MSFTKKFNTDVYRKSTNRLSFYKLNWLRKLMYDMLLRFGFCLCVPESFRTESARTDAATRRDGARRTHASRFLPCKCSSLSRFLHDNSIFWPSCFTAGEQRQPHSVAMTAACVHSISCIYPRYLANLNHVNDVAGWCRLLLLLYCTSYGRLDRMIAGDKAADITSFSGMWRHSRRRG